MTYNGAFDPYYQAAQAAYPNVPAGLLRSQGGVESSWNPSAVSSAGAQGVAQFMPATAKQYGLSNPFDPQSSIMAQGHYMSDLINRFGGNVPQALSAYSGGAKGYAAKVLAGQQTQPTQSGDPPMAPLPRALPLNGPNQGQNMPYSLGAMMAPQAPDFGSSGNTPYTPASLGDLSLPQGQIPQKSQSKFTAGNVLGTLGDALMAYGGMKPSFGPFLQEQQIMQQQQAFEREKFNQELQMRMYSLLHPEQFMQANLFKALPQDQRQNVIDYENQMHPNVVSAQQPNGAFSNQIVPRQLVPQVGDVVDGRPYLGGDPSSPNSWGAKR